MARRFRRFGYGRTRVPKPAIRESFNGMFDKIRKDGTHARQRCHGCAGWINFGDPAKRFTLAKRYRLPCNSCGTAPHGSRWFHEQCTPPDINKAMGYDPSHVNPNAYVPPTAQAAAAPPPKPKTATDLKIESLLAFEAALAAGLRDRSIVRTPELTKQLGTLNSIKQRIVRAGTPGEGEAATNVALKKLIDIIFVA